MRSSAKPRRLPSRISSILFTRKSEDSPPIAKHYLHWQPDTDQFRVQTKKSNPTHFTVYDCLYSAIQGTTPFFPASASAPYHLQEDIIILVQLASYNKHPDFQAFIRMEREGLLERDAWSIKDRYYSFIRELREDDIYAICRWVQRFGAVGFASFRFKRIRICILEEFDLEVDYTDWIIDRVVIEEDELKKKGSKYGPFQELASLNKTIILYSNLVRRPVKELLRLLHLFSGDFSLLDDYLTTGLDHRMWSQQDDVVLYQNNLKHTRFQRYRSKQQISRRRRYLNISQP